MALVLPCAGVCSEIAGWQQYENSHFVAYSNAAEDQAQQLLTELEYIRAAAAQTPTFVIPDGRPKTLVVLPSTQDEFARFAAYSTMAGFAQPLGDGAAIVMPVTGPRLDAQAIARHEFAHTMLFNEWFRYPPWYAEGFAEIVSEISVNRKRNTFTIGEMPGRYGRRLRPVINWDDLVADNFNAHALADRKTIQTAYAQNWLLFHYLTLNDTVDYASQLNHYFALLNSGSTSGDAFTEAFGETAGELWESALQRYLKDAPVVVRDFDPGELDTAFVVTDARPLVLTPIMRYFTAKADARRPGGGGQFPMTTITGAWDQLKIEDQCTEPLSFSVRDSGDVLQVDGFYSTIGDDVAIPGLFAFAAVGDGVYTLKNITGSEFPNVIVTADFQLSIRNNDVFCFDREPVAAPCGSVFQRCDQ